MVIARSVQIAALVALGTGAATALTLHPVFVPGPTGGNDIHKQGDYFGYPPDTATVVTAAVDRGANFSGPTDYPPERHAAYSFGTDTYFAAYEWNDVGDMMIGVKFWQDIGGIGFWSFESTPSELDYQTDAGRPSILGTETGLAIAYHGTTIDSDFQVYFNTFDQGQGAWGESLLIDGTIPSTNFPFLDRSSDGTYMIVCDKGPIANPTGDVTTFISADGLTWTESVVQTDVVTNWTLPTGASDPTNGDLYVAYSDDINDDTHADIAIHRSTDGGMTWSSQQTVTSGGPGDQRTFPSLVVDQDHVVHMIYQHNMAADYTSGGLNGLNSIGPAGPPSYLVGSFTGPDTWETTTDEALISREDLVALPDSCALSPTLANIATDTLSGIPMMGIHHGAGGDVLFASYNNSYMAVTAEGGGWSVCGPMQTWIQQFDMRSASEWGERVMVSNISAEEFQLDRNAMYVGLMQDVPLAGPGMVWSEMNAAVAPSDVMYNRPFMIEVGIDGDQPGAPAAPQGVALYPASPNPFNPMTQISYQLDAPTEVALQVYDAAGRQVRTLDRGLREAGTHRVSWNGNNDQGQQVASGVYFYRLSAAGQSTTRSMLLLK